MCAQEQAEFPTQPMEPAQEGQSGQCGFRIEQPGKREKEGRGRAIAYIAGKCPGT